MNILKKYPRLKINGICRHFKEVVEGEPMIYLVSALAKQLSRNLDKAYLTPLEFVREDKRTTIKVYRLGHNYFYDEKICTVFM